MVMAAILGGLLVYSAFTAQGGVPDPTDSARLSHGAVILNSGLLVLREGLEAILVGAAVTASFRGANREKRRPVAVGSTLAFAASVATWFIAAWFIGSLGAPGLDIQAATGLLAVLVLLVVMNWFFHRVYWTGWIQHHHTRRRKLLAAGGGGLTAGLLPFRLTGGASRGVGGGVG